ncbi:hypothetical protein SK128_007284 [Halocaridina rubra]|uniref:Uncharacterized protein n=1 Tax=Halocaridina rubra TaxID=373956 RepID=A0AAN9A8U9_HALRR
MNLVHLGYSFLKDCFSSNLSFDQLNVRKIIFQTIDFDQLAYEQLVSRNLPGFGDISSRPVELWITNSINALHTFVTEKTMFSNIGPRPLISAISEEQLMAKARWFALEIGLIEEEVDPMTKYKYKKSERGTVLETHPDRDGNKRIALVNAESSESTTRTPSNAVNIADEINEM